jgi:hypothetical protein
MAGGLGSDIPERQYIIILIDCIRGKFATDKFTE